MCGNKCEIELQTNKSSDKYFFEIFMPTLKKIKSLFPKESLGF